MHHDYHRSPGISRSQLFYISKSPEHFRHMLDNPPEPSADMVLGAAFHKLVLEPAGFGAEFAVLPEIDRRTKEGKALYAEFTQRIAPGVSVIFQADYATITAMRDKVMENALARALLQGTVETPIYWTDAITGELCKCKPDVLTEAGGKPIIVDLKTCREAEAEAFMRDSFRYGYELQAAMYKTGCDLTTGRKHEFVFVAVEKAPPYCVNVMQADDFFIERGEYLFREYMSIYHECNTTGNWYGYGGREGVVNNLTVPSWMIKEIS
jgi:hypothetical protein